MMLTIPVAGMEDRDGMEIDYVASFILFIFLFLWSSSTSG